MSSLPPEWVEQYEHCQDLIRDLTEISTSIAHVERELTNLNTRRMNAFKEREEQEIDRAIYEKAAEATSVTNTLRQKVRECDRILKAIRNAEKGTQADQHLCEHMCQSLAIQLQEKTREMRTQQRAYVDQRKKLDNSTKASFLEIAADKMMAEDFVEELQELDEDQLDLTVRNKEILEMVQSIHQLH